MIYFDNASTTSVHPEVVRIYGKLLAEVYGNADALHQLGRKSAAFSQKARKQIADCIGQDEKSILFTSCGSEANTLATVGYALANRNRGTHILTSNVEHSSTTHALDWLATQGFDVERIPVDKNGKVSPEAVKDRMRKDTILVSLMHVNNETGSVNPIAEIADVVHAHPTAAFHSDLVQSFGKLDIPWDKLDMASVSGHKIHGLKGTGFLYHKPNIRLQPLTFGGQQEQGLRGGTENTPDLVALAKAVRLATEGQKANNKAMHEINAFLRKEIEKMPDVHIQSPDDASDSILNLSFDRITSEVLLNALDERGVCVSAKSTCESHSDSKSEVLLAMGRSHDVASRAIRLSFSGESTIQEAKQFLTILKEVLETYGLPL